MYGIDTGIIASTIAQTTFKSYMYGSSLHNASLEGGIVSGYYAGYAFGSGSAAYTMDKISRRWTLLLGACVSIVGAVIQTAAVNPAMMIVGRALSGFSTGITYPTAPVYLAELSPPENRGFLVGLKGLMNTLGSFSGGWVGYAGSFAVGQLQWRVPLATQIPPAALLALVTIFLPYSPRWCKCIAVAWYSCHPGTTAVTELTLSCSLVAQKERYDEAKKVMYSLHGHRGSEVIEKEYSDMCQQIQLDSHANSMSNFMSLFTRQYMRRTLLVCLLVNMQKLSGSNIIQNYQSVMYNSLGYEGQTVLLIGAIYGVMAVIGQSINIFFVADHWTRRVTVISGSYCLAILLAVLAGLSKLVDASPNAAGSRAGVAFIFMFAFAYSLFFNSIGWVIIAEIFPLHLRGVGVGFGVFTQSLTAIWLSYAASIAFDAISWKFYFVFIACNVFAGTIYFFFLPETRFLTLEEIGAQFGDEVVVFAPPKTMATDHAEPSEDKEVVTKAKVTSDHVEHPLK